MAKSNIRTRANYIITPTKSHRSSSVNDFFSIKEKGAQEIMLCSPLQLLSNLSQTKN
jgi:hypothetical protein